MIYISTGGLCRQTPLQSIASLKDNDILNIELSGGRYVQKLSEKLVEIQRRNKAVNLQIHNYFPPPEEPFVLNLCSVNPLVADRSIKHIETAIGLAGRIGSCIYSFHAGFLIDPQVDELGKTIGRRKVLDRKVGIDSFIDRVDLVAGVAKAAGVELLIENNVISTTNFKQIGCDPLLMTHPDECKFIMENTPDNVNMLLDVAHLKVSAKTLDFEPVKMFEQCETWIKAYHLSDNNGFEDQNLAVAHDSWFWPYLNKELNYYSLEVYTADVDVLSAQYELAQSKIGNQT